MCVLGLADSRAVAREVFFQHDLQHEKRREQFCCILLDLANKVRRSMECT